MKLKKILNKIKFNWNTDTVSINGLLIFIEQQNDDLYEGDEIRISQQYHNDFHYSVFYFRHNKLLQVNPFYDYQRYNEGVI